MRTNPIVLFQSKTHMNLLLPDFQSNPAAIAANQHLIVHKGHGMMLDPGGSERLTKSQSMIDGLVDQLDAIVLSHQDPDIVASLSDWIPDEDNPITAYVPRVWARFIPHFGISHALEQSLAAVPDQGAWVELNGAPIALVPAHFLHSCGNVQVYDPTSKILYTGDLGASIGQGYDLVPEFESHIAFMEGFHRRYMGGRDMMKAWAEMARTLDIETIAPQHGAIMRGKGLVNQFIAWVEDLECGPDIWRKQLVMPSPDRPAPKPGRSKGPTGPTALERLMAYSPKRPV